MKMVKSLLLGSAAGLVAMAGAQAADLPVKAKPVQYVKICSLYGAGFYYIPGTDTCIKIGGFVRAEWNFNAAGSFGVTTASNFTRATQTETTRTRIVVSFDTRSQTAYGTLRSYGRGGWQWSSGDYQVGGSQGASSGTSAATWSGAALGSSSTTYFDRAFVQLAGFTAGKTQSFFDFIALSSYSNQTPWMQMDTGGSGTPVLAYTAQFGNGLSATISLEDATEQALPVVSVGTGAGTNNLGLGSDVGTNRANDGVPDIVANVRIDQAWGSAQLSGAMHRLAVSYYPGSVAGAFASPGDTWGAAVQGGLKINLPMLGKGDNLYLGAAYCSGATRYCSNPAGGVRGSGAFYALRDGNNVGFGNLSDGYYLSTGAGTGGSIEKARAYNFAAAIQHNWNAQWNTSLYGGYLKYEANSAAVNAACAAGTAGGTAAVLGAGCRDWSAWQIGTRTMWRPVANLDLSVDILYHQINSALKGTTTAGAVGTPALLTFGDASAWAGIFRVQRNFWP